MFYYGLHAFSCYYVLGIKPTNLYARSCYRANQLSLRCAREPISGQIAVPVSRVCLGLKSRLVIAEEEGINAGIYSQHSDDKRMLALNCVQMSLLLASEVFCPIIILVLSRNRCSKANSQRMLTNTSCRSFSGIQKLSYVYDLSSDKE